MIRKLLRFLGGGGENRQKTIEIDNVEVFAPNATAVDNSHTTVINITVKLTFHRGVRKLTRHSMTARHAGAVHLCGPFQAALTHKK